MKTFATIAASLILILFLAVALWWHRVPQSNVSNFNKWYQTTLSDRTIAYAENGFVDSEFFARVPMTQDEFEAIREKIGMTRASGAAQGGRPRWCKLPQGDYYVLDRISDREHRDLIEGHFDQSVGIGYFHYLDH